MQLTVIITVEFVENTNCRNLADLCAADTAAASTAPALLDWTTVHRMMLWNIILLLGGGFALADACKVTRSSKRIGVISNRIARVIVRQYKKSDLMLMGRATASV